MTVELELDGRVAIVTGGGNGIGRAYAMGLAACGARVGILDIDDGAAQNVASELEAAGSAAVGVHCDVSDEESVMNAVGKVRSALGPIDVLVNNAAIFATVKMSRSAFDEITPDEWDRMMAVNVRGPWLLCRAVADDMRRAGYGKIVNVGSDTALKGSPLRVHYVASKGAVMAFSRTLASELAPAGIRVNAVAPGIVLSEAAPTADRVEKALANQILPDPLLPDSVVGTVVYLCSPASDAVTGQTIVVNGGGYMY